MKHVLGAGLLLLLLLGAGQLLLGWFAAPAPAPGVALVPTAQRYPPPAPAPDSGQAVRTPQGGRVWEVYFHEGQRVRKGQLLLKLAQPLLSPTQQHLRTRLRQQQAALAALEATRPAPAPPALAAARQHLAATQAQLARTVPQLSFVFVTAPADGIIWGRTVAGPGAYLRPHAVVARLLVGTAAEDTTLLLSSVE